MKHADVAFGTIGTLGTITLTQFNGILACAAGVLTVFVMAIRARREWKNRNAPPKDDI